MADRQLRLDDLAVGCDDELNVAVHTDLVRIVDGVVVDTGAGGDVSVELMHQQIAALLDEADGATVDAETTAALAGADAWMAANADSDGRLPYGVPDWSPLYPEAHGYAESLFAFNNGQRDSPSCVPQWR